MHRWGSAGRGARPRRVRRERPIGPARRPAPARPARHPGHERARRRRIGRAGRGPRRSWRSCSATATGWPSGHSTPAASSTSTGSSTPPRSDARPVARRRCRAGLQARRHRLRAGQRLRRRLRRGRRPRHRDRLRGGSPPRPERRPAQGGPRVRQRAGAQALHARTAGRGPAFTPPGYLDDALPVLDPAAEEPRVLESMVAWLGARRAWRPLLDRTVLAHRTTVGFGDLPTSPAPPTSSALVADLRERLKGFDCSSPT